MYCLENTKMTKKQPPTMEKEITDLMNKYADNPEMLELFAKQQKKLMTQKKQKEKEEYKALEKEEKEARKKQLEKRRRQPLKDCKKDLKNLKQIEKVFDLTHLFENEDLKKRLREWYNSGIQPYNVYIKGEKGKEIFRTNARQFIELIKRIKQTDNFGIINSNSSTKNFYVKTREGIITGRQAELYIGYIIRTRALNPLKTYFGKIFEECNGVKASQDNRSIEDCFRSLSFFQLLNDTSLKFMLDKIGKDFFNPEFSKNIQKIKGNGLHEEIKIVDLCEETKKDIIRSCYTTLSIDDLNDDSDSSSESESESEGESEEEAEVEECSDSE